MKQINTMAFLGVGFTLVGYFVAICFFVWEASFYFTSTETDGTVVEIRKETNEDGYELFSPIYSFKTTDGKEIRHESDWETNPSLYEIGDPIEIRIKEERSKVSNFIGLWFLSTLIFTLMTIFFVPSLIIWRWTERKLKAERVGGHNSEGCAPFIVTP